MNILIIGGTSFFGKDIVELALEAGHKVNICSRGNTRPDFWDRIQHIPVDRNDHQAFVSAIGDKCFDIVIDNIAYTGDDVESALEVFKGKIGRYLLTTSNVVYMGSGPFNVPLVEDDVDLDAAIALSSTDSSEPQLLEYAKGKVAAEKTLLAQREIPFTILRPPNVQGPEEKTQRGQFYMQRLLDGKPLILTNGGSQPYQPIYRRDLARAFILAMESTNAVNEVYNIAQSESIPLIHWVRLLAKYLGVPMNTIGLPLEELEKADFQYAEPFVTGGATIRQNTAKARTQLGFEPTPITTWTAQTVEWYQQTKHGHDSPGYTDRPKEVAFASAVSDSKIKESKEI